MAGSRSGLGRARREPEVPRHSRLVAVKPAGRGSCGRTWDDLSFDRETDCKGLKPDTITVMYAFVDPRAGHLWRVTGIYRTHRRKESRMNSTTGEQNAR